MGKLKAYVTKRPGMVRSLARAAGVTEGQMSRIVHGERGASLAVALAIADATNGLITPADVHAARIVAEKRPVRKPKGRA